MTFSPTPAPVPLNDRRRRRRLGSGTTPPGFTADPNYAMPPDDVGLATPPRLQAILQFDRQRGRIRLRRQARRPADAIHLHRNQRVARTTRPQIGRHRRIALRPLFELDLETRIDINLNAIEGGYADVGFRLAFPAAPIPLADRLAELSKKGYIPPP